jgi:hypothetical protein
MRWSWVCGVWPKRRVIMEADELVKEFYDLVFEEYVRKVRRIIVSPMEKFEGLDIVVLFRSVLDLKDKLACGVVVEAFDFLSRSCGVLLTVTCAGFDDFYEESRFDKDCKYVVDNGIVFDRKPQRNILFYCFD